jgi:hypothetical protein
MINENMEQETESKTTNNINNQINIQEQDTTITKARSRVTANMPAFFSNSPTSDLQNGKLIEFMLHCQKTGFSDATTKTKFKILRLMHRNNVNLSDPEAVKPFTAQRKSWSNGHKQHRNY